VNTMDGRWEREWDSMIEFALNPLVQWVRPRNRDWVQEEYHLMVEWHLTPEISSTMLASVCPGEGIAFGK
jgi:hypothetical protein